MSELLSPVTDVFSVYEEVRVNLGLLRESWKSWIISELRPPYCILFYFRIDWY